jgi:PAS domain S-box-containing protein
MLFGSVDGFYRFDPERIRPDSFSPPVVFTSLRVFNEPVERSGALAGPRALALSHNDRIFSIEFAALDFALPRRNQYAYRMEGLDDQWIELGRKREVTFTNLDPGSYVFRVKASNGDGVWTDAATAALRIELRPPFWGTWWFRGLGLALTALALGVAHRVRVRHLTAALAARKRTEHALRAAEEKYRGIFEAAVEGIFQSTPEGRFATVNPALARMLGYDSPEQMLAEVDDIQRQVYVDPTRRRELIRLLEERGVVHGFESELRRRDGISIWVSETVRLARDDARRPLYYEGMLEDVTRRRAAQRAEAELRAALEESALEWQLTFDSIDASIALLDEQAKVIRLNRAARELAGLAGDEDAVGRQVDEVSPGEPWRKTALLALAVAETGRGEEAQVRDAASGRTWDLTAAPLLRVRAGEQCTIVVARDVTRVVELQESLRRSETMSAMGSLLAGVAHEVRNPLFGISANLDVFERKYGVSGQHDQTIALLRSEVSRLVTLMHDLLDFGRPVQQEPAPGSLADVVAEAVKACETMARASGVQLSSALPPRLANVRMDRKRLVQAFQNLLQNAIQHSSAGGSVRVEAAQRQRNGAPWLRCAVTDSGPGFEAGDLAAVFRPFFTRRRGGTGLGLAIVQRVVEAHGGSVSAANRAEGGAEVTVWLPASEAAVARSEAG